MNTVYEVLLCSREELKMVFIGHYSKKEIRQTPYFSNFRKYGRQPELLIKEGKRAKARKRHISIANGILVVKLYNLYLYLSLVL